MLIKKENRVRSPKHRAYVASLPCMLYHSWDETVVDHHLLRAHPIKGGSLKSCDVWTVPANAKHHKDVHAAGDEIEFYSGEGWEYDEVKAHALEIALGSPCKKVRDRAKEYQHEMLDQIF